MALVKLGCVAVEMSGTSSGIQITKDMSGLHFNSIQRRVKRCSPSQKVVRKAFSQSTVHWNHLPIDGPERASWLYFANHPETAYQAHQRTTWYWFRNVGTAPDFAPL